MSEATSIRKIVIAGRDEALWLAASILRATFHRTALQIIAIELPSQRHAIDVIPSLRSQQAFHDLMGIPEGPLMGTAQGTFSLGQRFAGFSGKAAPFMHGYGSYGVAMNSIRFHQHWIKARSQGLPAAFDTFSLNAVAANQGKFFIPGPETDRFATCDYGYHFDAMAYIAVVKQILLARGGVTHIAATALADVTRDDAGDITAIHLPDGQVVDGDLFVDATGAESLLLGGVMQAQARSWGHWFPCDRVLTAYGPPISALPAFSQVSAFASGWFGLTPLRNRTGVQLVYGSTGLSDAEALQAAARLAGMPLARDHHIGVLSPGKRQAWTGNCVGVGEAAAIFDPIDNVGLQSLMLGLSHLTSLVPLDRDMSSERKEYNLNVTSGLERLRDYQIAHYKLNRRDGEALWDAARAMTVPETLAYKIKLFEARGHLVEYDDETFVDYDWHALFLGHGLIPRAYDPVVDETPDAEVIQHFQSLLGLIRQTVTAMKPMAAHFTHTG